MIKKEHYSINEDFDCFNYYSYEIIAIAKRIPGKIGEPSTDIHYWISWKNERIYCGVISAGTFKRIFGEIPEVSPKNLKESLKKDLNKSLAIPGRVPTETSMETPRGTTRRITWKFSIGICKLMHEGILEYLEQYLKKPVKKFL